MKPFQSTGFFVKVALLLVAVLFSACAALPSEEDARRAAYTAGASTSFARLTSEAAQTAAVTPAVPPAITPPPKQTPSPTPSPAPTLPETVPTVPPATAGPAATLPPPTAPAEPCNRMEVLGDVNLPPDASIPAGQLFTKVWRVRNAGACTWTTRYALVFTGGSLIDASSTSPTITALPAVVPPGALIDLTVSLVAPSQPGVYQGTWKLRSDDGELFGEGADGALALFTRLQIYSSSTARGVVYDIGANACFGTWRSAAGLLPCPGSPLDSNGSVAFVQSPRLESDRTGDYILWTRPNLDRNGWIQGLTEPILIHSQDHFITEIGCLSGNPGCDVLFQLDYHTSTGAVQNLGSWNETYDGLSTFINVDLSFLAGRSVSLVLTVFNRGRPAEANAYWVLPQVQPGVSRASTLHWTREGHPNNNSCQELEVFYTGANSATAIARDCRAGTYELGRTNLNGAQLAQLQRWEQRLADFDGEIYTASGGNPVISWVIFQGGGASQANQTDIQALGEFAAQIFNQITQ